ncbi:MAG: hypothetical protein JWP29_2457 [Rhodoferax sp.]|nr:hypothetical protein [Rhodoferax sp.]
MSLAPNPYAAPQANVADVNLADQGVQPVRVFAAKGRIGRLRFLAYNMIAYALAMALAGGLGGMIGNSGNVSGAIALGVVVLIPYAVLAFMWGIQRSHDMDWNGWTVLIACIPVVGFLWAVKAGTPGRNRYGAPPPPNGWFIKICGLMLPIVIVVGIVAAIALPAYQQYAQRAKASQAVKP